MKKYWEILKSVALFSGIQENDLQLLLSCLSAKTVHFEKNQMVFLSGEQTNDFGIVLSGQVQIFQEDYYGNKSIYANIGPGHLFGESFACAQIKSLPVSVMTTAESDLLFIDCRRLSSPCTNACAFHVC
jgi:CRP-like cAMP-binding protein